MEAEYSPTISWPTLTTVYQVAILACAQARSGREQFLSFHPGLSARIQALNQHKTTALFHGTLLNNCNLLECFIADVHTALGIGSQARLERILARSLLLFTTLSTTIYKVDNSFTLVARLSAELAPRHVAAEDGFFFSSQLSIL